MMSRSVKALLVVVALVVGAVPAYSICVRHPWDVYFCSSQCTWYSSGVYCGASEDLYRACWESGTGNSCGEDRDYPDCHCSGVGGF
jgi:hypothetical protein